MMAELPADASAVLKRLLPRVRTQRMRTEFLPGGYTNRNFRLRIADQDLVLRIVNPAHTMPGVDRARERAVLKGAAKEVGPRLEAFALPEGHMLTRFVGGKPLDAARPPPARLASYLARLHATLGRLPTAYALDEVLRGYVALAQEHGSPVTASVARAVERFSWRPALVVPCHNDLNPWNVIVTGDDPTKWVTLDWEVAGMGDPWFDLIVMIEGIALPAADERIVIEGYAIETGRRAPDESDWARLRRAFLLREHLWAHAQCALGNRRDEIALQRDTTFARLNSLD
jgi:aminoglycoside phosphotransferase (APT) family kinase protein